METTLIKTWKNPGLDNVPTTRSPPNRAGTKRGLGDVSHSADLIISVLRSTIKFAPLSANRVPGTLVWSTPARQGGSHGGPET